MIYWCGLLRVILAPSSTWSEDSLIVKMVYWVLALFLCLSFLALFSPVLSLSLHYSLWLLSIDCFFHTPPPPACPPHCFLLLWPDWGCFTQACEHLFVQVILLNSLALADVCRAFTIWPFVVSLFPLAGSSLHPFLFTKYSFPNYLVWSRNITKIIFQLNENRWMSGAFNKRGIHVNMRLTGADCGG